MTPSSEQLSEVVLTAEESAALARYMLDHGVPPYNSYIPADSDAALLNAVFTKVDDERISHAD